MRVRGNTEEELPRILDDAEPDEVIIAIPSAPGSTRARIVRECRSRGIPVRTLPTVFELLQTRGALARQMREVRVEDVLGREPVQMELERVGAYLAGETVLVTGAGGSIGAELCRQIARVEPHRIVLLDHAEDNLFAIQRELEDERHVPPSMLAAVLADCKEEERMREVFAEHRPTVVFHAAAYKHVGLMEANPVEAVRNNALATRVVAHVAGEHGATRFVLVSTDKAVAPATVMGASKALAEFALEAADGALSRDLLRGGALRQRARLLRQRRADLPPPDRARRPGDGDRRADDALLHDDPRGRAADHPQRRSLAGERRGARGRRCASDGAEVFVLDMGEPVRILELARAMIELSGLDPDRDIEIEIVGRRAGEKLHEELFNSYERARADDRREDPAGRARAARRRGGRVDLRRDRPARARGRRGRPGGEGRRAVGASHVEAGTAPSAGERSAVAADRREPASNRARVRLRPSYTLGIHDLDAARALALELRSPRSARSLRLLRCSGSRSSRCWSSRRRAS